MTGKYWQNNSELRRRFGARMILGEAVEIQTLSTVNNYAPRGRCLTEGRGSLNYQA